MGEADDGLRGADRPDAMVAGEAGSEVVDDGLQLTAVVFEVSLRFPQREREATDLCLAGRLGAGRVAGKPTPGAVSVASGSGPRASSRSASSPVSSNARSRLVCAVLPSTMS